jgi:S-adenosylmethionine hydrolase
VSIIALLTDFGLQDHYVGAMKGAILGACPSATLVDVSHDIPAHDVAAGALALAAAVPAFPAATVFVAVVDPGVGSRRRALAAAVGPWVFVAPDNGLLTAVWDEHGDGALHEITNASLFRARVSPTFHGRDVFGPVAGALARGLPLGDVGPAAHAPVRLPFPAVTALPPREWVGAVLQVDRFGNLTTNVGPDTLTAVLDAVDGDPTEVVVEVEGMVLPLVRTYADVAPGEPCALVGSSGRLEIAAHGTSAARLLGAARDAPVRLRALRPSAGGPML